MRTVCGEHVIVAEGLEVINFNKLLSLNESAAYLWEQAAALGDFTAEQLADKLCEEYEVTREQALADVDKMIAQWQDGITHGASVATCCCASSWASDRYRLPC